MQNYVGKQIDRYRITERLGLGGMAVVYKAFDTRLERDVALKLIRVEEIPPSQHERLMKRFEREAKAMAKFSHPNIVPVYDYGEVDGSPYLVMEYIPGGTLKDKTGRPVPVETAIGWIAPIADALAYAHEFGIIHRDVKPSNILFDQKCRPILTDFGIAKILETDEATLTGTGLGVGTPEYMAPEQWQGKVSEATDQYALGVVLYELITGKKPYSADTPAAVAILQATEPLAPPSKLVRGVPEAVEKVLYKALARNPEDRYEDMAAFQGALEGLLLEGEMQGAEKPAQTEQQRKPASAVVDMVSSEGETRDALDTTPAEGIRTADKRARPKKRTLPNWALWAGAGMIGLVVIVFLIGIGGNLMDSGKDGEEMLAMVGDDIPKEYSTVTISPTQTVLRKPDNGAIDIDCMGAEEGDEITMLLYQWSGVEEENLNQILQPFVDACGITIRAESTHDEAILDTRVQDGTPPDIANCNATQLQQYKDQLYSMPELGVVEENYPDFWKKLGSIDGEWLGLPVKAYPKSLVWYSPANFDEEGYAVPETWDDLESLAEQMVSDGQVPWSMGFECGDATGWTGTDFIQDILLVTQGSDFVRGIIDGSVPYNDPAVKKAWEIYGKWAKDEKYTLGGAYGTVSTNFIDAILLVFSYPPEAMMVKQPGFVGGLIRETYPDLEYGTGYAFFGVPGAQGLQGGSDWMMAFSDKLAVKALVKFLSSDIGGQKWAEVGFDLTPNLAGRGMYLNDELQDKGEILYGAEDYVTDIGDSIPGRFYIAEFDGITEYINGGDLDAILENLTQVQQEGFD